MSGVYGRMLAIPNRARSGALPTYQGGGQVYAPGAGVSERLSDVGGRLAGEAAQESARGLANLAKAADRAVQAGINAYEDYQVARAKDAFNKYQQEEMELRARLNTLKGRNALGDEGVEAQLGRWRTGARQRLAGELGINSVASLMFGRAADRQDAETDAWAIGKVDRERTAYANGVDEAAIINATNKAMQDPMDHAAVGEAVGAIRATYDSMARRNGWDASYRDARFGEARQKMFGEMVASAIQAEDLGTARTLLKMHGADLGGLKGTLEARIQAKGRELAGRARAAQAMAAACFEDQLAYGMDRGDFRAAEQTIQTLHEMGSHKEAARLQEALALSREAYTALSGGQDLSLIQQEGDARKRLDALVTPENARGSIKMREQVEAQMKKRRDAFLNDPAGFVEGIPESWRAASTTHEPGTVAFFAERSRRRLALQRELGQGLPYTPRILTDSEAQNARNEYDRQESPAAKAAYLGKLQAGTGDYFPQVLRELKMPPSVMAVAPVFSSLPKREAGLFLEASGLKPGDIPGGHDSDLRKEAEARVDASDIMQAVTGMAQDLPTSPQLRSLATHMRQAMVNADLLGLAPDTLDGMFTVIDDSGMRLVIPRAAQVDTDDLEDVLRSARQDVFREYMQASTAAAGSYEDRLNAAKARALAENGIFISSGDGTGAVLVDPVSGAPVALPDGRLVRVPYAEVPARARKARDARMKQDLQEAVDTAMEGF